MSVDVTVISAFYNRAESVDLSLASLHAQTCRSFRAVVVDDGSTDDTWDRLRRHHGGPVVARHQANMGLTATLSSLCAEADSEFIAIHGAGDESLPERLERQVDFLRAHPQVVAVGCGIENVDEITGRRWHVLPQQQIRPGPIRNRFGISHGEVMFRRDAYLRAGGYRTAFPLGQASDLFRRMSRLGDFGYADQVLYRRYLRLDGVSAKPDKVAQRDVLAAISTAVHEWAMANGSAADPQPRISDQLDRWGLLLPYFAPPSRHVAQALAGAATMYWATGDRAQGLHLARRSLAETVTLRGWMALALIAAGVGPLRGALLALTHRASRSKGEFALRRFTADDQTGS